VKSCGTSRGAGWLSGSQFRALEALRATESPSVQTKMSLRERLVTLALGSSGSSVAPTCTTFDLIYPKRSLVRAGTGAEIDFLM